jgi:hypothetical protein
MVVLVGKAPALSDPQQGFLRLRPQGSSLVCFQQCRASRRKIASLSAVGRCSNCIVLLSTSASGVRERAAGSFPTPLTTALQRAIQADDRGVSAG